MINTTPNRTQSTISPITGKPAEIIYLDGKPEYGPPSTQPTQPWDSFQGDFEGEDDILSQYREDY